MEANLKEFRVSNDILCSPDALKSRLLEEGYLFFKGLIEPDQIGELRSEILDLYNQHEWLLAGTDPLGGAGRQIKELRRGGTSILGVVSAPVRTSFVPRCGSRPSAHRHHGQGGKRPRFPLPGAIKCRAGPCAKVGFTVNRLAASHSEADSKTYRDLSCPIPE